VQTDAELLYLIVAGDAEAFADLYNRYKSELYCYARALLRDNNCAEDVIQDAFLRLFNDGKNIREPSALRQWLYIVVRRLSYDALNQNRLLHPLDEEKPSLDPTPLEMVEQTLKVEALQEALQHLAIGYREVIYFREYMQLSYEEICNITGASLPAIKSKLFKARKALTAALVPYFKE